MKKLLLVTVIAVLGLTNVNAQEIKFGIKGGLNLSQIKGLSIQGSDRITDYNFGFLVEIPISEKISFQPELLYSGQGSSTKLNYLNIPLMGKYYAAKGFSLEAGPQIGYLLSAKKNGTNLKSTFHKLDFGVNFGLGFKFNNGLNFGARYNLGLSDINKTINSSCKHKNEVFQLTIGYNFF